MKRVFSVLVVTALMAAMLVASTMPAFAKAIRSGKNCTEGEAVTSFAGVEGDACNRSVTTPSDNVNEQQHFTPAKRPNGGSVEQGAEKDLDNSCPDPPSPGGHCNVVF